MASKRMRENGTWEYSFLRKGLLPGRVYLTFDTEVEGDAYAERVEALLDRGVVPVELTDGHLETFGDLLERFEKTPLSQSDRELLPALVKRIGCTKMVRLSYPWVEDWVEAMQDEGLAPSTLVKRVGLLARAVDWGMRRTLVSCAANPLRLLPRGYSTKGRVEKERSWSGERDRRLEEAEERALRSVLAEKKGADDERVLFEMALESAMRLREMYTLTRDQVSFTQQTIFLDRTKNGDKRQVPMSSVLIRVLQAHLLSHSDEKVFPTLWDGKLDEIALKATTNRLSHRFSARAVAAGCPDVRFHDLRHTATSRIYERTNLTDIEISRITGHKDARMLRRYSNLRGSDLSKRLW